jgi:hypothetical protein
MSQINALMTGSHSTVPPGNVWTGDQFGKTFEDLRSRVHSNEMVCLSDWLYDETEHV